MSNKRKRPRNPQGEFSGGTPGGRQLGNTGEHDSSSRKPSEKVARKTSRSRGSGNSGEHDSSSRRSPTQRHGAAVRAAVAMKAGTPPTGSIANQDWGTGGMYPAGSYMDVARMQPGVQPSPGTNRLGVNLNFGGGLTRPVQQFNTGMDAINQYNAQHRPNNTVSLLPQNYPGYDYHPVNQPQQALPQNYPGNGGSPTTDVIKPKTGAGSAGSVSAGQFPNDRDRGSGGLQGDWPSAGAGSGGSIPQSVLDALDDLAKGTGIEWTPGSPIQVHMPAFPKAPDFKFKRNDFSQEANDAMAKAYGPRYAAIDAAKQSVVEQQARSDEIVKGIFTKLYSDLGSGTRATKSEYDSAAAQALSSGQNTAAGIRQGAQNTNADLAAQMKANGLGPQEIAAALASTAGQTNDAQAAALTAGQQNQQSMAAQGGAATDFARTMAGAAQNQGAVSREQIAADAAQAIQGYSNQALDISGQQAAQAIDYGQNLSAQDLNLQEMQYGVLSDRYQGEVGSYNAAASGAFQNAGLMQNYQGQLQNEHQFESQQLSEERRARAQIANDAYKAFLDGQISMAEATAKIQKQEADQKAADAKAAEDARRWNLTYGLKKDEAAAGIANDDRTAAETERHHRAGEGVDGAGTKYGEQADATQILMEIGSVYKDPAEAEKYYTALSTAINNNGQLLAYSEPQFITQMQEMLKDSGLSPYGVQVAASSFWKHYGKSPASAVQSGG